jgi:hypothetical protein
MTKGGEWIASRSQIDAGGKQLDRFNFVDRCDGRRMTAGELGSTAFGTPNLQNILLPSFSCHLFGAEPTYCR